MLNLFSNLKQIVTFISVWIAVNNILSYKIFIAQTPLPSTFLEVHGKQHLDKEEFHDNPQNLCPANLGNEISEILSRPEFRRSRWGILVQTLFTKKTLYALEADKYFIPASNIKLFTTAATLYKLGSSWKIRTSIYQDNNNYIIVGRGDPSLTTKDLQDLANKIKQQGITKISNLVFDKSYFQQSYILPSWEWGDIYFYYATSVSSFILNENKVDLELLPGKLGQELQFNWSDDLAGSQWQIKNETITAPEGNPYNITINGILGKPILDIKGELAIDSDSDVWELAVADPVNYFLESFRNILLSEGIYVVNHEINNSSISTLDLSREVAAIESDSLAILVNKTNQESNNLFAEALMQILKTELEVETGAEAITKALTELGVNPEGYELADGSGLSRHNLVSPSAMVETLTLMKQIPEGNIYQNSLPLGGVSGSLKRRFLNTPPGIVRAKTGTLSGVSALSGYLELPNYEPLVFSIIVNQSDRSAKILRNGIDEIVLLLMNLQTC